MKYVIDGKTICSLAMEQAIRDELIPAGDYVAQFHIDASDNPVKVELYFTPKSKDPA